uniref:hypothetical protein n=1 Tax=Rhodoferax sp. TaxID=50421 RepID=UPI00351D7BE0
MTACNTTPTMPMGSASASGMATPEQMARMDAQMKTMRDMHEKMMGTKSQEERSKLMAEHMAAMQDGMAMMNMMNMMSGSGMGGRGGMQGSRPMPGDMNQRQQMMEKRMDMMQSMMQMMMDRMPAPANK